VCEQEYITLSQPEISGWVTQLSRAICFAYLAKYVTLLADLYFLEKSKIG
jgi:hypothetical protein